MASLLNEEPWGAGARIGRYEILSKIAAGGMATVFLGRAHGAAGFERLVALKVCHPHLLEDEQAVERFLAEARLAARIHHPNVVATLDVVQEPTLCIAMEYVEGGSLASLIVAARDRGERIPPPLCLRVVVDLLAGLHAAHTLAGSNGAPLHLVHRDVTPQNVLVGADGIARIADFGILKADGQPSHTAAGNVRGKLPYLAPEQFEPGALTQRVDVYAAGVVLWEALAGARLFQGSDFEVANQIRNLPRPPIRERVPELPEELDAVIARAMARDPDARFASAAELSEALEKLSIPVASTREVAAFVNELLREQLEERRTSIPEPGGAEKTQVTEPGRHETAPERPSAARDATAEAPLITPTDPGSVLPTAIIPAPALRRSGTTSLERRRGARGPLRLVLTVTLLAVAAAVAWTAFTRSETARIQPEPVMVKVVSPTPAVQPALPPPPAPIPPKPAAQPTAIAPAAQKVEEPARASKPKPHHKPRPAHSGAPKPAKPFEPDTL